MHDMCASIHVLFCLIFFVILYFTLYKGLRMVAWALWRSEALRVVPWLRPCQRIVRGLRPRHSPACLPDLHNAAGYHS